MTDLPDTDFTQRFIFDESDARGEMVSLELSYAEVLAKHAYPEPVAQLLGDPGYLELSPAQRVERLRQEQKVGSHALDPAAQEASSLFRLLAWYHATALNNALNKKWVPWGLLDQFTEQPLVQRELAKKATAPFDLKMRTKAEEDPVVAAASIVARAEFVRQMHALSLKFGDKLQKGASAAVKLQAHEIIRKFGAPALRDFAKLHFRTAYEVVSEAGKLDELPLPRPADRTEWGKW